jgi:FAD:protein FMN transferase
MASKLDGSALLSRRQVILLGAGAFAVALVPAALRLRRRRLIQRSIPVMGTIAEISVVHRDPGAAERAIDLALAELRWVDRTMTRYAVGSDVGRANRLAGADAVAVSAATALVVREALEWAAATGGRYDPALARVSELWDVTRRTAPPAGSRWRRYAGRRLYRFLDVDPGRPRLRFDDPDVGIDLGGIAKGYAVDRAVEALRQAGMTDAVVDAGGDLYAMGRSADGDRWRVGIRSPADPGMIQGTEELEDAAIATSGDYFQGFDYHGRRYGHIMDAATAAPRVSRLHSVSVLADRCLTADAGATAAFGLAPEAADRLVRQASPGARVVSVL